MRLPLSAIYILLRDAAMAFNEDKAPRLAAAVAYYSVFALAPALFFILAVASGLLTKVNVRDQLFEFLAQNLNASAIEYVKSILPEHTQLQRSVTWASALGLGTLFMGATGLFIQVQDALNSLWGTEATPKITWLSLVKSRILAFAFVLSFGVLVVGFLVANTYLTAWAAHWGLSGFLLRLVSLAISVPLLTLVFASIYKFMPNVRLAWQEVWVGSAITAFLFTLGQIGIGIYLGRTALASAYGAAGSLVILLFWIYLSSMIFFFGAEITWVYSQKYGSRAGGRANIAKTEALVAHGADLGQGAIHSAAFPEDDPVMVPKPPRLLPSVRGALLQTLLTLLALPTLLILRALGLGHQFWRRRKREM